MGRRTVRDVIRHKDVCLTGNKFLSLWCLYDLSFHEFGPIPRFNNLLRRFIKEKRLTLINQNILVKVKIKNLLF